MQMTMEPFDLLGPLPTGTTLLEASAGTGKTYTVAGLVARFVAEGEATLDQLLVVTFGRSATQELRERVREQLVRTQRALSTGDADDDLLRLLVSQDRPERLRRITDALASFDAATIATTHQFCRIVLDSLGVAGDSDAGATLAESTEELLTEVVDDLYLARYGQLDRAPFGRTEALRVARAAEADPRAALSESDDERVAFAAAARREMERRKRRLGILSYDDLLGRLADALLDEPAQARMRQRWRIVLVDEFQDTDPVQWQVLDRAFTGHARMVLIGDPKQAIYGFRGGDVVTYLAAAHTAATQQTLDTNHRSDAALVQRLLVPLAGAQLGHPEIVVRPVEAVHPTRLSDGAAFRIRQVRREGLRRTRAGLVVTDAARDFVANDCAADIAALVGSGARWCDRPVRAGDVAVLVPAWAAGERVQRALQARGVPAVLTGGSDVLQTPAAEQWLTLLEALDAPHRSGLVRAAGLTCFFGLTAAELDEGESRTALLSDTLRGWALLVRGRGLAALMEAAEERGLTRRLLSTQDGERLLTDVRHLGQLLHDTAVRERLGLNALLAWLRAERQRTVSERPRRLDSDAAAVQIMTIHGSKGLEFPIVYLPFAWDNFVGVPDVARFHLDGERRLDVAGGHVAEHQAEELGEELRKLYVALTRAQSQVVAWWAPTANTEASGLHRLLFGRQPGVAEVPERVPVKDDDYIARVLGMIAERGGPVHEEAQIAPAAPAVVSGPAVALAARTFDRQVDTEWRRTSYSGLIRVDEGAAVGSEPEVQGTDDEAGLDAAAGAPSSTDVGEAPARSPMADLPAGATFGSLVHAVLEHADPAGGRDELVEHIKEQLRWWPVDATPEELADGLEPLNHAGLGPLADDLTLARIPLSDRLRELDFEFPLGGASRLGDLGPVLRDHLAADDPIRPYADRLIGELGDQVLRGFLSGSIDVLLRTPSGRFLVVDYKTNHLGEQLDDYAPERLAEAMLHSHYPLQALLYSVVAHRFLRWRVPGYDPEVHLGGVLYLYLRGMAPGSDTGVFSWRPPASLVVALSEVLDA